jgi:hypothetical protein
MAQNTKGHVQEEEHTRNRIKKDVLATKQYITLSIVTQSPKNGKRLRRFHYGKPET